MKLIQAGVPESIKEFVENVELAEQITHQIWREDNTLLGYGILNTEKLIVYPLRFIDIGQLYAELDVQGLTSISIIIKNTTDLNVIDSIEKTENYLDLDGLKALKMARLKNRFESIKIRPKVPVLSNKFFVDGSKDDLTNFESYYELLISSNLSAGVIKDADGNMQNVTTNELEQIILEIKKYGLTLYQLKWQKEAEIVQATTVDELKNISINII